MERILKALEYVIYAVSLVGFFWTLGILIALAEDLWKTKKYTGHWL